MRISPVGHKAALYAVQHWHYSGTVPMGQKVTLGVWEDDRYVGCVIYSHGTGVKTGIRWGLARDPG
jgi:hypothetical protein